MLTIYCECVLQWQQKPIKVILNRLILTFTVIYHPLIIFCFLFLCWEETGYMIRHPILLLNPHLASKIDYYIESWMIFASNVQLKAKIMVDRCFMPHNVFSCFFGIKSTTGTCTNVSSNISIMGFNYHVEKPTFIM